MLYFSKLSIIVSSICKLNSENKQKYQGNKVS